MNHVSLRSTARSEWLKFRSVRSTLYGLITMFVLSIGLGTVIDITSLHHAGDGGFIDPLTRSLFGHFFAQFVVGVVGALYITNEYSNASIRTTLAAVPRRTLLIMSKLLVMTVTFLIVTEILCFAMFFIGQAIFKGQIASFGIGDPGVLRGIALAGVYLMFLGGLGFALGLLLRKTSATIVVFVVTLLVLPGLVRLLPSDWGGPIIRYLPNTLGEGMMSVNHADGTFTPWVCALILFGYIATLIALGIYVINNRDA